MDEIINDDFIQKFRQKKKMFAKYRVRVMTLR